MARNQETTAIKRALTTAGYKVRSVGHGTGTAYMWIHVRLSTPAPYAVIQAVVPIVARAIGREDWGENCIGVDGAW